MVEMLESLGDDSPLGQYTPENFSGKAERPLDVSTVTATDPCPLPPAPVYDNVYVAEAAMAVTS